MPKKQSALCYICPQTSQIAQTAQNKRTPCNDAIDAMTSHLFVVPLQHAAVLEFCVCWLLHFCKFHANPSSTLNLTVSSESQRNRDSNDILSIRKYCELFTYMLNTFLLKIRHWNQWANGSKKTQKTYLPLEARGPPSSASMPGYINAWSHLTHHPKRQLDRFTHFGTTTQQFPHWLQWDALSTSPKLPLPIQWLPSPSNTPIPRPTPLTNPNGIKTHSSFLPQYTFRTDRQTNQQMGSATGLHH